MKLDVYGRVLEVVRENEKWVTYRLGEGKKTPLGEFYIPAEYTEAEVIRFLEDTFHEAATPQKPSVIRLSDGSR